MIPHTIEFTGLTLTGAEFAKRFEPKMDIVPFEWDRIHCTLPFATKHLPEAMVEWMNENIHGRWDAVWVNICKRSFVIRFEDRDDAVMFRLAGGENAWHQK